MCIGDFRERGDEGGIDNVLVYYIGDYTNGSYGGYGKHLATILFARIQCLSLLIHIWNVEGKKPNEIVNSSLWGWFLSPTITATGGMIGGVKPSYLGKLP